MKQYGVNDTFPCKELKRQRLGRFTEWVLTRRGKRDAANGAVRKDANGTYSSPFLRQEIALCVAQIHRERETLQSTLFELQSVVATRKLDIERLDTERERISASDVPEFFDYVFRLDDNTPLDTLIEPMADILKCTRRAVVDQRKNSISAAIDLIYAENERAKIRQEKEIEISMLRCNQAYDVMRARLYAYWNGVLSAHIDMPDITPSLDEQLLDGITKELRVFNQEVADDGN